MPDENAFQVCYDMGVHWAMSHHDVLLKLLNDPAKFEAQARLAFEISGFPECMTSLKSRQYYYYRRNQNVAESKFVAGAWNSMNGDLGLAEFIGSGK